MAIIVECTADTHSVNGYHPELSDVIDEPITIFPSKETDSSVVRNSDYRTYGSILNPLIPIIHKASKGHIKAKHISWGSLIANMAATELAEYQHRTGKYTGKRTFGSILLRIVGEIGDGIDGKYARYERSLMTDEEQRKKQERDGQALDPFIDGLGEAHKKFAGGITAWLEGDTESASAAFRGLRKTNLPRTAKAAVGSLGVAVPESYKPWDIRFFGTSLGRKFPDFISTFIHKVRGVPVRQHLDDFTSVANDTVTLERLSSVIKSPTLSKKEIDNAQFRFKVLGAESFIFYLVGHSLEKLLLTTRTKEGSSTP